MCNDLVDMHKAQQWLLSPLSQFQELFNAAAEIFQRRRRVKFYPVGGMRERAGEA